jgi:hypothetical protein
MIEALTTQPAAQLVPASYAEKAMASLMQLHSELMDEKEKRVDLFRKLMEKEQALAELKMYVKMLEEKMTPVVPVVAAPPPRPIVMPVEPPAPPPPIAQPPRPGRTPPVPPRLHNNRPRVDGWKTW